MSACYLPVLGVGDSAEDSEMGHRSLPAIVQRHCLDECGVISTWAGVARVSDGCLVAAKWTVGERPELSWCQLGSDWTG